MLGKKMLGGFKRLWTSIVVKTTVSNNEHQGHFYGHHSNVACAANNTLK